MTKKTCETCDYYDNLEDEPPCIACGIKATHENPFPSWQKTEVHTFVASYPIPTRIFDDIILIAKRGRPDTINIIVSRVIYNDCG